MGRNVAARSLEFTGIRLALRKPLIMPTGGLDQPNNADGADAVVITPDYTWRTDRLTSLLGYILELQRTNPNVADTDGDGLFRW